MGGPLGLAVGPGSPEPALRAEDAEVGQPGRTEGCGPSGEAWGWEMEQLFTAAWPATRLIHTSLACHPAQTSQGGTQAKTQTGERRSVERSGLSVHLEVCTHSPPLGC